MSGRVYKRVCGHGSGPVRKADSALGNVKAAIRACCAGPSSIDPKLRTPFFSGARQREGRLVSSASTRFDRNRLSPHGASSCRTGTTRDPSKCPHCWHCADQRSERMGILCSQLPRRSTGSNDCIRTSEAARINQPGHRLAGDASRHVGIKT